jgi:four helix bundle protein
VQHFTNLKVWTKAHQLNLGVCRACTAFPNWARYTIASQLQRCAASVPANIVEGTACSSDRETIRFLVIARRSAAETEYFLLMARDIELLSPEDYAKLYDLVVEVQRMLNSFISTLRHRLRQQPTP